MAAWACDLRTDASEGIDGIARSREARGQEPHSIIGGQLGVAPQIGVRGDPWHLIGPESVPAMRTGELRQELACHRAYKVASGRRFTLLAEGNTRREIDEDRAVYPACRSDGMLRDSPA